jgi:hypothetical protein
VTTGAARDRRPAVTLVVDPAISVRKSARTDSNARLRRFLDAVPGPPGSGEETSGTTTADEVAFQLL